MAAKKLPHEHGHGHGAAGTTAEKLSHDLETGVDMGKLPHSHDHGHGHEHTHGREAEGETKKLPHDHGNNLARVLEKIPDSSYFLDAAAIFQQLGDGSRLRIFWLLCHCEECGINIAAAVGMSTAAVSHHLRTLRLHGLITSRRDGKEVYYTLADVEKAQLIHKMVDDFFHMACPGKGI